MKSSNKKPRILCSDDRSGLFIPSGIFLGMGVGFLTDQLVAGLFIGLGAGFLLMALAKMLTKKK